MSLHATYFAASGLGQLLRAQGEAVTYRTAAGVETALTALVGNKQTIRKDGRAPASAYQHERIITITKDPSSEFGGVAEPQKNATLVYGGEEYAVEGIESESTTAARLRCGFVGAASLEAADTRRRR